jgi:cellulose synthase/poly-beta-1,6-N-acetylglucosamine synthase-like glycosyltransferase
LSDLLAPHDSLLTKSPSPVLSIVVPAHNAAATLRACLEALLQAPGPAREIVVVDDGSQDSSAEIAHSLGVRTIRNKIKLGPAAARNEGERSTDSPILVFVDADVVIHPDALKIIASCLLERDDHAAVFGSYDANPVGTGLVSQYRNLLHHFTHQTGNVEAETFWTGLGAVRRSAFHLVGGFACRRHAIEDVEFGLQLHDAGFRIALDPKLLGRHLKCWTLAAMLKTDVFDRALPWSQLVLTRLKFTSDLNTAPRKLVSAFFAHLASVAAVSGIFLPQILLPALLSLLLAIACEARLYRDFAKARGLIFALCTIPLHLVHQLCAGFGFGLATCKWIFTASASSYVSLRRHLRIFADHRSG